MWFLARVCECVCLAQNGYFVLLHKVYVGGPLDLHGLALAVVQRQHKVEEVGFAQVGGGLFLIVSSCQTHAAAGRKSPAREEKREREEKERKRKMISIMTIQCFFFFVFFLVERPELKRPVKCLNVYTLYSTLIILFYFIYNIE